MLARTLVLSSLLLAWALPGALAASATPAGSATPAAAAPSASPDAQIDPNFLLLPAYDLQWVNPPQSIRVGDTLTARLSAADAGSAPAPALPKEIEIKIPPGTENADDLPFSWDDSVSTAANGTLTVRVTPTKPGELVLPSLALADASGKFLARTNPERLTVASAIASNDPKPKQPDPPRPPVSLGIPVATLIVLAILALALVAALVFWLVRWSRNRKAELPPRLAEPPKPEDEIALARLAQLERKGLLKAGQFKAHYFAISEILKHYVGARYEFDAAESTTYEMITYLENGGERTAHGAVELLRGIFEKLDRVKFTDHVPVAVEGTELLEEARKLVMTTRRPPPAILSPSSSGNNGVSTGAAG